MVSIPRFIPASPWPDREPVRDVEECAPGGRPRICEHDGRAVVTVFADLLLERDLSEQVDAGPDRARQVGGDLLPTTGAEHVHPRPVG